MREGLALKLLELCFEALPQSCLQAHAALVLWQEGAARPSRTLLLSLALSVASVGHGLFSIWLKTYANRCVAYLWCGLYLAQCLAGAAAKALTLGLLGAAFRRRALLWGLPLALAARLALTGWVHRLAMDGEGGGGGRWAGSGSYSSSLRGFLGSTHARLLPPWCRLALLAVVRLFSDFFLLGGPPRALLAAAVPPAIELAAAAAVALLGLGRPFPAGSRPAVRRLVWGLLGAAALERACLLAVAAGYKARPGRRRQGLRGFWDDRDQDAGHGGGAVTCAGGHGLAPRRQVAGCWACWGEGAGRWGWGCAARACADELCGACAAGCHVELPLLPAAKQHRVHAVSPGGSAAAAAAAAAPGSAPTPPKPPPPPPDPWGLLPPKTSATCRFRHPLFAFRAQGVMFCSGGLPDCQVEVAEGGALWGCRTCLYLLCRSCVLKTEKNNAAGAGAGARCGGCGGALGPELEMPLAEAGHSCADCQHRTGSAAARGLGVRRALRRGERARRCPRGCLGGTLCAPCAAALERPLDARTKLCARGHALGGARRAWRAGLRCAKCAARGPCRRAAAGPLAGRLPLGALLWACPECKYYLCESCENSGTVILATPRSDRDRSSACSLEVPIESPSPVKTQSAARGLGGDSSKEGQRKQQQCGGEEPPGSPFGAATATPGPSADAGPAPSLLGGQTKSAAALPAQRGAELASETSGEEEGEGEKDQLISPAQKKEAVSNNNSVAVRVAVQRDLSQLKTKMGKSSGSLQTHHLHDMAERDAFSFPRKTVHYPSSPPPSTQTSLISSKDMKRDLSFLKTKLAESPPRPRRRRSKKSAALMGGGLWSQNNQQRPHEHTVNGQQRHHHLPPVAAHRQRVKIGGVAKNNNSSSTNGVFIIQPEKKTNNEGSSAASMLHNDQHGADEYKHEKQEGCPIIIKKEALI